jgi:hypothetical protein
MGGIDPFSTMFLLIFIFVGIYFNMLWLTVIFLIVTVLYFASAARAPKVQRVRVPVPQGPMVRPIVVKRRYVGPESIYPQKMKVRVTPPGFWTGVPWWEWAGGYFGSGLNAGKNVIKRSFKD